MFRNYLKIALRTLWRNGLLTSINVLGLSVGLACVVVLVLFAQKCLTWDTSHANLDRIYHVRTQTGGEPYNQTVYPLLDQMLRDYPEIEAGTHTQSWNYPWIEYGGKSIQEPTSFVDSTYFRVFTFPFKYGNPATALINKRSVVLSEPVAQNLFGETNPVGKYVTVSDTLQYAVTGVLEKLPANSSQQFEVLMPAANLLDNPEFRDNADWSNTFASTFILLRKGRSGAPADPARLEAKLPRLVKAHYKAHAKNSILRLAPFKNFIYTENPSFSGLIYGSITIALFLLFIISVNLINLNTASALPRAKEVAMRQVVGATRRLVLGQFWTESGVVVVISLALSVLFALLYLIPNVNQLRSGSMQLSLDLATDYPTILTVLGIALTVALVAGTYPALYLLGLKTTEAVKGKLSASPKQGRFRQNGLIVLQFALAIVLILGTIGMREQLQYMKEAPLGYDKANVLVFKTDLAYRDEKRALSRGRAIFDRLRQNPSVVSFTSTYYTPVAYQNNFNQYYPDGNQNQQVHLRHMGGAVNYTETLKIPMLEGRNFSDATLGDSVSNAVLINESAMRAFGWKTAVGRKLRQLNSSSVYTVIGVTKDYHYRDLTDRVEPMLQAYNGRESLSRYLMVRITDPAKAPVLIAGLEREFNQIPARRALTYTYLSDDIARAYRSLDNIWRMISFVTLVALLTACAGIFGLITLVAKQRTKEIGVRKVLGASVASITSLLSADFLKLVGLAIGIAVPVGWLLGQRLLNYFAYHIQIQWWYFAIAGLLAVGIALGAVVFQAIRAALMNPVKSLRSE
ncbi:ABC transporter permease [Spirosoma areae]